MFKYLAKKLYPYLEPLIDEKVQGVMYRATDAQLATDTLAEKLGYTIVIDFETGIASVHGAGEMKTEIKITNCEDCPFRKSHRGQGECWEYCAHPDNNREAYGDILWGCQAEFKATPEWCPVKCVSVEG